MRRIAIPNQRLGEKNDNELTASKRQVKATSFKSRLRRPSKIDHEAMNDTRYLDDDSPASRLIR